MVDAYEGGIAVVPAMAVGLEACSDDAVAANVAVVDTTAAAASAAFEAAAAP